MYFTSTKQFTAIKPKNKIPLVTELNRPKYSNPVVINNVNKKIPTNQMSPLII